jgi:hypothetical protein
VAISLNIIGGLVFVMVIQYVFYKIGAECLCIVKYNIIIRWISDFRRLSSVVWKFSYVESLPRLDKHHTVTMTMAHGSKASCILALCTRCRWVASFVLQLFYRKNH